MSQSATQLHLTQFESRLWNEGYTRVMGLDEVGRGCLAGPVVAAGVIFDPDDIPEGINDSKQLSVHQRNHLYDVITSRAKYWVIQEGSIDEIDRLNILWASLNTMQRCETHSGAQPDYLLIDGNRYVPTLTPHTCVVKGDSRSVSIAAASILAKVHRDRLMSQFHNEYPMYCWDRNVGYPTKDHYEALMKFGITRYHRRSFRLRADFEYQEK